MHDLVAAARDHVLPALYWAAAHLDLPTLAERGYEGAGIGIHTPIKQPADGRALAPRETASTTRCSVGCAPCASAASPCSSARWRALRFTCSPERIGTVVKAALVLTHFEYRRVSRKLVRSLHWGIGIGGSCSKTTGNASSARWKGPGRQTNSSTGTAGVMSGTAVHN